MFQLLLTVSFTRNFHDFQLHSLYFSFFKILIKFIIITLIYKNVFILIPVSSLIKFSFWLVVFLFSNFLSLSNEHWLVARFAYSAYFRRIECTRTRHATSNAAGEKDTQPECDQMTELRCRSGECVPLESRCDGVSQCNDNSDEDNCPTDSLNKTRDGKYAELRDLLPAKSRKLYIMLDRC